MIQADPGTKFDAVLTLGPSHTGLVGTLGIQVVIPDTQIVEISRTQVGVAEFPAGTGIYGVQLTAPLAPGLYGVVWDINGGVDLNPSNSWVDSLQVTIEEPEFPGGWSWSPWGWIWPAWSDWGNVSDAPAGSNPIPVAADVRAASKLAFDEYGYPASADATPGGLQEIVDRAESLFWRITGQQLDAIDAKAAPLVRRVIQGMTEQMVMQGSEDVLDTQSDWDLISGFSAGPYNENHRGPGEMRAAWALNPVPWISDALWSLLTQERYEWYWHFFSGSNMPAFATSDVFWQDGLVLGQLYGASGPGYWWGA